MTPLEQEANTPGRVLVWRQKGRGVLVAQLTVALRVLLFERCVATTGDGFILRFGAIHDTWAEALDAAEAAWLASTARAGWLTVDELRVAIIAERDALERAAVALRGGP